jgi:shikimate kinase
VSTGARSRDASLARAERLLAAGKNLYVAGFMGTGKSSAAKAMSRMLGVPWIDLDESVAREQGCSVAQLFATRGERAFRNAEHRALKAAVALGGRIVALGGGTVCFERNRALLRGSGPVVVLTAPVETILERVGASDARPLLAGPDAAAKARALLARRTRYYRRFRLRVDTGELTARGAAEGVLDAIDVAGRKAEAARARDMAGRRGGTCR